MSILPPLLESRTFHDSHTVAEFNTNVADKFSSDPSNVASNVKLLKDWLDVSTRTFVAVAIAANLSH